MSFDFDPTLALFNSARLSQEMADFGIAGFGGCSFTKGISTCKSPILGIKHFYVLHQVHGSVLAYPKGPKQLAYTVPLRKVGLRSFPDNADGWFLSKKDWLRSGIAFCIKTADCMPIILFASEHVAMLHAGWRGLQQGIIINALNHFKAVGDLPHYAALGPSADPTLYEVGSEFIEMFPDSIRQSSQKIYTLNMYQEAIRQLEEGAFSGTLESSNVHTMSDKRLFSYRSSQQHNTEGEVPISDAQNDRNYALIGFLQPKDTPNILG